MSARPAASILQTPMSHSEFDAWYMARALELARRGEGAVEPNPMVGCTIVVDDQIVGEGWHQRFGAAHAEVAALQVAGARAAGATMYVTLEPCCHHGKTPPCTEAIVRAGVKRVVAALPDPFPAVGGQGFAALRQAGVEVSVGLLAAEAESLAAPYLKLVRRGQPWIIAKWAMTLDGKIATRSGASRWISGESSRAIVQRLRARVDAILVGATTALKDDPLLTARPPGPRTPVRIVLDTQASLPIDSQLVRTARQVPVLIAMGEQANPDSVDRLRAAGCEVFACAGADRKSRLDHLLGELGRRRMTNVLVEGGGQVIGSLLDAGHVDEVHVFIAPRLFGGAAAPCPVGGLGAALVSESTRLVGVEVQTIGSDVYMHGRIARAQLSDT
jgi:diaminohydroxyphosphoribosylaminopyrimidine deaminase/5-amino-6-(5-phosphoribosylamino)uracil reductase